MNSVWTRLACAACLCLVGMSTAAAAERKPLANKEAFELYGRAVQLMESTSFAVPELARAGAPIVENTRQALVTMRSLGRQHLAVTYTLLSNLRAYLGLADAIPMPETMTPAATQQFVELRAIFGQIEANYRVLLQARESEARTPDRDNLARYAEANSKLGPPHPAHPRVVFFGDSITDFWRLNEYFPGRDFVNRGISGQITGQMLGRMEPDVIALKPEAMLVLAGTNDIAWGVPLETIEANLTAIADLAEAHGIKVLLASVLPVSDYHKDAEPSFERSRQRPPQTIRALNDWIQSFCHRHNCIYVDYFSQLVDAKGFLQADLADDGLHPNGSGYRVMAPIALAAIDKTAAANRARRRK